MGLSSPTVRPWNIGICDLDSHSTVDSFIREVSFRHFVLKYFSGRRDGRSLIQYTDLDAPDDDIF